MNPGLEILTSAEKIASFSQKTSPRAANHFTRGARATCFPRVTNRLPAQVKDISTCVSPQKTHTETTSSTVPSGAIMDRRTPYTLSVLAPSQDGADESRTQIQARLREFVLAFQLDNAFIYR